MVCSPSSAPPRHNSPLRPDQMWQFCKKQVAPLTGKGKAVSIVVAVPTLADVFPAVCAVGRAFPFHTTAKTGGPAARVPPKVSVVCAEGPVPDDLLQRCGTAATSIELAAALVDLPPCDFNVGAYVELVDGLSKTVGYECTVHTGAALKEMGLNGLYDVGKQAVEAPAMVVCSKRVDEGRRSADTRSVVWVGKGITYDTGGLSLKPRDGMCGMKSDMGGSAAVFGAFLAAVQQPLDFDLHMILCLAENAIGPAAVRHDDVIRMYSGKTVEVNNTDAEGRLVLGDGVAYAAKHLSPSFVLDMATLTGAQMVTTGMKVGAVLTDTDAVEAQAVAAGKASGDLVFPIVYIPEYGLPEFDSPWADMKNSVKNRSNAQCSCAGLFIESHLKATGYAGPWLHVDMAGPSTDSDRGTGWGVAFLLKMFDVM
mmetsp:Transcript_20849/g.34643  ORF Transcript_20849/g.34643 Transcript_20849/m.34643 type:complete len:424 (+) Transcript_20849:1-1272(+)